MERLMIIDSDLIQIKILRDGLSRHYLTLASNRGAKAMDLLRVFQPSALILDPATHELNGREFIRSIRSLPFRGNIPIIALTRFTTIKNVEESINLGVNVIFSKPCSAERIKMKLDHYFGKGAPELELAGV